MPPKAARVKRPPPPPASPRPKTPRTSEGDVPPAKRLKRPPPAEAARAEAGPWATHDGSVLWRCGGPSTPCPVVAAFDMDSTLIDTKSGKAFPTGRADWKWLFPTIPATLRRLHEEGRRLVLFSNQAGIGGKGWNPSMATAVTGKIDDLAQELGVPLWAYVATRDDQYRKPCTRMWTLMVDTALGGASCDLKRSMFVGDAAGRPAGWAAGRKKDFSCSDRKFAANVGVAFHTPEEYFQDAPAAPFDWHGAIDSKAYAFPTAVTPEGGTEFHRPGPELVVFCGLPASGKTTFAGRHFLPHGYAHVNRDTLQTPKKCYDTAEGALKEGRSCVVDNTMPRFKSEDVHMCSGRQAYVALAQKYGVPCRLFHFQTPLPVAQHLNYYRERLTQGREAHVPRIAYNVFAKAFQPPTLGEGWAEIVPIMFVPHFPDQEAEVLFHQFA